MEENSNLFLPDQVCFPLYASSRMITRLYQPLLEAFEITYPQYLVLLVLWQHKKLSVTELGSKLFLKTNTLTPLIRKMKEKKLLTKQRSNKDERTVFVSLTPKGQDLQEKAKGVPKELINSLNMSSEDLEDIRAIMWRFLDNFIDTKES
ncbi:MAG: MarR family transcriptional regulator [Bacteroidetes bacterium]|jgi:MarR family transcriptional regulator, organic hydroperoxide resistance regulator|nr:MarR family transcriptional regulator [Bacteroidota bacterium]